MDVIGAVVAHAFQVNALEDLQGLDAHWTLTPGAAGIDINSLVCAVGRRIDANMKISQVLHSQQATIFLVELHHLLGYLALVKEIPGRLNRFFSPLKSVLLFNLNQTLEASSQVLLNQNLAFFKGPPTGIKDLSSGRPHGLFVGLVGYAVANGVSEIGGQGCGYGKSVFRQLHGRGYHLLKSHGAV